MAIDSGKASITQRWDSYRPTKTSLVWACAGTAVATMVIGFTLGGWVTGGSSHDMVMSAGNTARSDLASDICVERFNATSDSSGRLAELKALTRVTARRQFVEAGGWATMPGQTTPDRIGADTCAKALIAA